MDEQWVLRTPLFHSDHSRRHSCILVSECTQEKHKSTRWRGGTCPSSTTAHTAASGATSMARSRTCNWCSIAVGHGCRASASICLVWKLCRKQETRITQDGEPCEWKCCSKAYVEDARRVPETAAMAPARKDGDVEHVGHKETLEQQADRCPRLGCRHAAAEVAAEQRDPEENPSKRKAHYAKPPLHLERQRVNGIARVEKALKNEVRCNDHHRP